MAATGAAAAAAPSAAAAAAALPSNPYASRPSLAAGGQGFGTGGVGSVVSPPGQQMQQQQQQQSQPQQPTSSKMPTMMTGSAIVVRLLTNDDGTAIANSGGGSSGVNENDVTERAVRRNCEWSSGTGCQGLVRDIMATQGLGLVGPGGGGGGAGAAALRDAIQIVVGAGGDGGGSGNGNENNNGGSSGGGSGSIASSTRRQLIRTATDQITTSVRLVLLLTALFDAVQAAKKAPPLGSGSSGYGGGSGANASSSEGAHQSSAGTANARNGADENNANANAIVSVPKLAATELVKACTATMAALAKSIGNAASAATSSTSANGDDGSVTWSVPTAQFALESSYRAFRPIVMGKAQFLQLWRGITDVALASWGVVSSPVLSVSSSGMDGTIAADANRRYYSALSDATVTLLGYVKEGTDALWTHLSPALLPSASASATIEVLGTDPDLPGKLRHLVKMFVFLLARLAHVLSIMVTTNDDNGGGGRSIKPLPPPPEVLSSVMNHMARLRGISVRLEIIAERAKGSGEEETLVILDKIRKDVLEPIAKMGSKADALVGKNLLPSSSSATKSKAEQGGAGRAKEASAATTAVHRAALNALLGVADQPLQSGKDDDSDDESDNESMARQLQHRWRWANYSCSGLSFASFDRLHPRKAVVPAMQPRRKPIWTQLSQYPRICSSSHSLYATKALIRLIPTIPLVHQFFSTWPISLPTAPFGMSCALMAPTNLRLPQQHLLVPRTTQMYSLPLPTRRICC